MLNVAEQENVTARHLAAVSHRYARFPHLAAPVSELVAAREETLVSRLPHDWVLQCAKFVGEGG
jgi:hypothetical protein